MAFQGNQSQGRLALIAGAIALPVMGIAYLVRRSSHSDPNSRLPRIPVAAVGKVPAGEPDTWTPAQVHQWLASIGATDDVMLAFHRDGVEGATLPILQDVHLEKMGVTSVSQRVKVLRAIRVLFHLPITESVAPTPQVSPTAPRRHVAAAAPPPESDSDSESDGAAEAPAPAAHQRDDAGIAQTHAVTTLAGKMQSWFQVLTSAEFEQLPLPQRKARISTAARELSSIARLLQTLPVSPPVQELKAIATQLMDVISAANAAAVEEEQEADAEPQPPQQAASAARSGSAVSDEAGRKIVELLNQFDELLTSPQLTGVPKEQQRNIARGIGEQLVKIRQTLVTVIPENQRDQFERKIDSLLQICVTLQSDEKPMFQRTATGSQACCGGAAHVHEDALEAGLTANDARPPQPASLNFLITRLRGVFEQIKSPQFLGESDPQRRKAMVAEAAREVHSLTRESEHMTPEQREIVMQVAQNIIAVLTKINEATQQELEQKAGKQEEDSTTTDRHVEVAQMMSKQLVAMLNVLKSAEFEAAPPLQRRAIATRMKNDLDVMNTRLSQQGSSEVRELLEPTRVKLLEFVNTILSMTSDPAAVGVRPGRATGTQEEPANDDEAEDDDEQASEEPAGDVATEAREIANHLLAIVNVFQSPNLSTASAEQRQALGRKVTTDLAMLGARIKKLPPQLQEILVETWRKASEFAQLLQPTAEAAPPQQQQQQQGSSQQAAEAIRSISAQLTNMLEVLKSDKFESASLSQKRAVVLEMQRELDEIAKKSSTLPAELKQLIDPLHKKLSGFVDAVIKAAVEQDAADTRRGVTAAAAPLTTKGSPSKLSRERASAAAATAVQAAALQPAAGRAQPSEEFKRVLGQMNQIADIVSGPEFASQPNSQKLDVIVKCQQLLGNLVQRVAKLNGAEQSLAMDSASKVNKLLKAIADPIVAEVDGQDSEADEDEAQNEEEEEEDDGDEPVVQTRAASAADTMNARALNVVQRTQRLFQAINDDSFLDATPAVMKRKAAVLRRELVEVAQECRQLDREQQENLAPVLNNLADILGKIERAAATGVTSPDEPQREQQDADDEEDNEVPDERRKQIYAMAAQMAAALTSGAFPVTDTEGVEHLSQLLNLLDTCGVANERELSIREKYQNAVEKAIQRLSNQLQGDMDRLNAAAESAQQRPIDEDGEEEEEEEEEEDVEETTTRNATGGTASRVEDLPDDEADEEEESDEDEDDYETEDAPAAPGNAERQQLQATATDAMGTRLQTLIGMLNAAESSADLERLTPMLAMIAKSEAGSRDRKNLALLSQAVGVLQRKRQEFAAPTIDLTPLKNTLRRIIISLRTAPAAQLPTIIHELTTATEANDEWKRDQEATALVNTAIAEISAAVKRAEGTAAPAASPPRDEAKSGDSKIALLLRDATRRINEGADPQRFIPLALQVSQMQSSLAPNELQAFRDFEMAIAEARRQSSVSDDGLITPPNTPASPPRKPTTAAAPVDETVSPQRRAVAQAAQQEPKDDEEEDDESAILSAIGKIKERIANANIRSFADVTPYITLLQRLRQGAGASPSIDAAVTEVENIVRAKLEALQAQRSNLKDSRSQQKRLLAQELTRMIKHPRFGTLEPEARNTVLRKATELLKSLDEAEQEEMSEEVTELLALLEHATLAEEEANTESPEDAEVAADLTVLPRVIERLGSPDFMENCSTFEVQSIARMLTRLETTNESETHEELRTIVRHASKLLAERVAEYTGDSKNEKEASTPLDITGMQSESEESRSVIRYTVFSKEEAEEFTVAREFADRFKRDPAAPAALPEGAVESWRGKSAALMFVFEESPLDSESTNATALGEANHLADLLAGEHGFDVLRVWGTPTAASMKETIASVADRGLKRLFIYVANPAVKRQLPPVPEHAVIFSAGDLLKHTDIINMAKQHSDFVVLYHDNGSNLEVLSALEGTVGAHLGLSATEAGFLVANSGRCWLYDGLFTPILLEALTSQSRTLCAEDLINTAVRTLAAVDGTDGPYLNEPASSTAFFAPGLAAPEE